MRVDVWRGLGPMRLRFDRCDRNRIDMESQMCVRVFISRIYSALSSAAFARHISFPSCRGPSADIHVEVSYCSRVERARAEYRSRARAAQARTTWTSERRSFTQIHCCLVSMRHRCKASRQRARALCLRFNLSARRFWKRIVHVDGRRATGEAKRTFPSFCAMNDAKLEQYDLYRKCTGFFASATRSAAERQS